MPDMVSDEIHGIVIGVHSSREPSDEEWQSYMNLTERVAAEGRLEAILVLTQGGGPNAKQRQSIKTMNEVARRAPTAVLTDSRVARGVVTAVRWMGKDIRAFAPNDWDGTFSYLEVDGAHRGDVRALVHQLMASVS